MKDPAFLFYDGDAARDVSHMNRLERGAYFDLIQAQRKFGGYTVEQARKILGKDFDNCWDALSLVLSKENEVYFIEWVKESIKKREEHAEIQRKRIQDYWDKKKNKKERKKKSGNTTVLPYENEIEIENLYNSIVVFFDEDCRPKNEDQKSKWKDILDKLIRIDGHSSEEIKKIVKRTRMDNFWRTNFLSISKLRDKNKDGIPYFTVFAKKIQPDDRTIQPVLSVTVKNPNEYR